MKCRTLLIILCCLPMVIFAQGSSTNPQDFLPDRIILRITDAYRSQCQNHDIQIAPLKQYLSQMGVNQVEKLYPNHQRPETEFNTLGQKMADISLIYELTLPAQTDLPAMCRKLNDFPQVQYAEPRFIYDTLFTPNDTWVSSQWYLDSCHVKEAWDLQKGDSTIAIGIIDTGTSLTHPDIAPQIQYNPNDPIDGVDNDLDGYIDNYSGWDFAHKNHDPSFVGSGPALDHGVLVTGPACARTNNGQFFAGIGYHTKFVPLKAGPDGMPLITHGYEAIVYGADRDISIMNLSWGGTGFSQYGENITRYAAVNKQCLLVAAAGNTHLCLNFYPASYDHVISVAATAGSNNIWTPSANSNTGSTYGYKVDLMAPGKSVPTTAGHNSVWWGATGTSLSAPMVCGAAALVKAHFPGYTSIQAGQRVRVTAKDVSQLAINSLPQYDYKLGKGLLNVYAALTTNTPAIQNLNQNIQTPDDLIAESHDTLYITGTFVNYLDPSSDLKICIEPLDTTYLKALGDTISLGVVGSMDTFHLSKPIRLVVKGGLTSKINTNYTFRYLDGSYDDFEVKNIDLFPASINIDVNHMKLSVMDNSIFGQVPNLHPNHGLGMRYKDTLSCLTEGGLLLGSGAVNVADNVGHSNFFGDMDFSYSETPYVSYGGPNADQFVAIDFADRHQLPSPTGVDVTQYNYAFTDTAHDDYVIFEYLFSNQDTVTKSGLRAGLFLNWAFDTNSESFTYDTTTQTLYVWSSQPEYNHYYGVTFLNDELANPYSVPEMWFGFGDMGKWNAMSGVSPLFGSNANFMQTLSSMPFTLNPNDHKKVAFALVGGSTQEELLQHAQNAFLKYQCDILNNVPTVSLGNDTLVCPGTELTLGVDPLMYSQAHWTDADSGFFYQAGMGTHNVTVYNEVGCSATDDIVIAEIPNQYVDAGPDLTVCKGELVELLASTASQYQWGPASMLSNPTQNPTQLVATQSATITLEAQTAQGCTVFDTLDITVNPVPDAQFLSSVNGPQIMLLPINTSAAAYFWDFGDGNTSTSSTPSHTYSQSGNYTVCLTVTDALGCESTRCETLNVVITGVDQPLAAEEVRFYPVPATDQINIEALHQVTGIVGVRIYNLQGQLVKALEGDYTAKLVIPVEDLAAATYLFEVRTTAGTHLQMVPKK